ncbi:MAG: hypothetical protein NUV50_13845 [Rhodospirillales bacterium]|nr:hypothetical protein [Rhodospirillales bacterium]
MTSDCLTPPRSLKELDALFERDRLSAAKVAKTVFAHEVAIAIANISEINQIANARIVADSQIASAKMLTDAEVTATMLLSKAEIAVLQLEQYAVGDSENISKHQTMILEISRTTTRKISTAADEAIKTIQRDAIEAIERMQENAAGAIKTIHTIAETLAHEVEARAAIAQEALATEQSQARTPEETIDNAQASIDEILAHAHVSREKLHEATTKIIADMEAMSTSAIHSISQAMTAAEQRIAEAKNRAIAQVESLVFQLAPQILPSYTPKP